MKVLIVETDALFRDFLEKSFKSWSYDVTCVATGDEALKVLKNDEFSFTVINGAVPDLDGMALCEKIRTEIDDQKIYILLIISKSRKEDSKRGFDAGASDLITKYIDENELRTRVQLGERVVRLENELSEKTAQLKALTERLKADKD